MDEEVKKKIQESMRALEAEMDEDGKITLQAYIKIFPKNYERLLKLLKQMEKIKMIYAQQNNRNSKRGI